MVGKFQKKLEKTVPISVISVKIPLFSIVGIEVSMQSSTKLHDGFSESSLRAGKLLFRGRFQNSDGNLHNALTIQRSKGFLFRFSTCPTPSFRPKVSALETNLGMYGTYLLNFPKSKLDAKGLSVSTS